MDTQTAACAFRVCWLVSLHAASCRFTSRLLLAAADVLRICIASLCNEAIDTKTVQNLQITALSAAHLHRKHSTSTLAPQAQQHTCTTSTASASARNSTKKTLYLPPPCFPKIARAGLPYFIQAENNEAIWAPDARHQSGEGNQGSHNAGFMMI